MKILLVQKSDHPAVNYALSEVAAALLHAGQSMITAHHWRVGTADVVLCVGETTRPYMEKHIPEALRDAFEPETMMLQSSVMGGQRMVIAAGGDELGLCYALFELAARIERQGAAALTQDFEMFLHPQNNVRAVSRFLLSHRDDGWFYSEEFWEYYCKRLLTSHFNRFVLIVGFDTAYLSPPYPFFVDVPGYEGVTLDDAAASEEGKARNLSTLRMIGRICHKYCVSFEFATWQQVPWTKQQKLTVVGLPEGEEALSAYCADGLRELVNRCPEIDVVQLRINHEAGVGGEESSDPFWRKLIDALAGAQRRVKLNLRAKGLTPALIAYAMEQDLELLVSTKYWCEHLPLPYHIPVLRTEERKRIANYNSSQRYGYGDLLTRPVVYQMIYRMWNYGSSTLFLWGDIDYARRFSQSLFDANGDGFEITAPLSLKGGMSSIEGEDWPIFGDPAYRGGDFEDERYWAWYLCFGRAGYNRELSDDFILLEYEKRFGEKRGRALMHAVMAASRVLPLITTLHMPVHPSEQYWPELCTGGALFAQNNYVKQYGDISYGSALPSDEQLFISVDQCARNVLEDKLAAKYTPLQAREWLTHLARATRCALAECGDISSTPEGRSAATDLAMLTALAEYHAWKITAAYHLAVYNVSRDALEAGKSLYAMEKALGFWRELSNAGAPYNEKLEFRLGNEEYIGKCGTWKDRLPELEADLAKLRTISQEPVETFIDQRAPHVQTNALVPERHVPGADLVVKLKVSAFSDVDKATLFYRNMNHREGLFHELSMEREGDEFTGVVPGGYIDARWNLMLYFAGVDNHGNAFVHPGVFSPDCATPYYTVRTD